MGAVPRVPPPLPTAPANCGPGTHPDPLNPAVCISDKEPDEGKTGTGEPQPGDTCNCADYHRPGTSCWTVCQGQGQPGQQPCPQPGQIKDATGKCACPPGTTIHGDSTRGCEPEGGELCDPAAHPFFNAKKGRIDESNPEAHCYWCDFSTRTWQRGHCPGASAGAAARAAGQPAKSTGINFGAFPSGDLARRLQSIIEGDLTGPSRFTPEMMQRLYGAVTQQSAGRIARGQRDVLAQAARAGRSSRWGSTQAGLRAVREGAETERGKANLQVDFQKIQADYTDRQAALTRTQQFLDSMRDNEYRYTLMGEQRRQFDSNLALGYANLAQQRQNLLTQLQSQWDMMRAMQGFLALLQGV